MQPMATAECSGNFINIHLCFIEPNFHSMQNPFQNLCSQPEQKLFRYYKQQ